MRDCPGWRGPAAPRRAPSGRTPPRGWPPVRPCPGQPEDERPDRDRGDAYALRAHGPDPAEEGAPAARSMPVSSLASRTAAAANPSSDSSRRPPGSAICPDHGSRLESARLITSRSQSRDGGVRRVVRGGFGRCANRAGEGTRPCAGRGPQDRRHRRVLAPGVGSGGLHRTEAVRQFGRQQGQAQSRRPPTRRPGQDPRCACAAASGSGAATRSPGFARRVLESLQSPHRRDQQRAQRPGAHTLGQAMLCDHRGRPLEVFEPRNHELHLVASRQVIEVGPAVAILFSDPGHFRSMIVCTRGSSTPTSSAPEVSISTV